MRSFKWGIDLSKFYDPATFTYGAEVEWGDVDRRLAIPEHLGKWEHAETDIVNMRPPYRFRACDPLGIDPPMGGEINTVPTKTWLAQVLKIVELRDWFIAHGCAPTPSCVSHLHTHVHVPGLREDIDALKRLITYIKANQALTVEQCQGFFDTADMRLIKGAKMYLKYDCGKLMPDWMADNIVKYATDFDSFIKFFKVGKDGIIHQRILRPYRYGINPYCLKYIDTIEFRCFQATIKEQEMADQFRFCEKFIDAALNDGPSVEQILAGGSFNFAPMVWDFNAVAGWAQTKWGKERGHKERSYVEVE